MRTLDHQDANVELDTQLLGPLPIVNAFRDRLGLPALLAQYLPGSDARLKLAPATAVGAVVANLVLHRQPVYALGEWAAPFDPAPCSGWARARRVCSMTTGSGGCWPGSSTRTGPAC